MNKRLMSPFAHLGRRAAAPLAAETDDDKKSKAKGEGEDDKEEDEEGDDKKGDDAKGKSKSKKAEGGDEKKKDEDEGDDDAKASDDDDETDDQDMSARSARARERRRIRAIMVSASGRADPIAAAHLAMDTSMPRAQAIGLLTAMQAGREGAPAAAAPSAREGLRSRMDSVPNPAVGADAEGGKGSGPSLADRIVAAGKKRRGEA